jgi:hypothetical protein
MRRLWIGLLLLTPWAGYGAEGKKIEMTTSSPFSSEGWYGILDFRHYNNVFYTEQGRYQKTEPSFHVTTRLGKTFYEGKLDISGLFGLVKVPETQKVFARRPEVEVDFYPVRGVYGNIVQYSIAELPFSDSEYDKEAKDPEVQGSVYTVGLSGNLTYSFFDGTLSPIASVDSWTKLYSRRRYIDEEDDEGDRDRDFFLKMSDEGEPVEDTQHPLYLQTMAGFSYSPPFLRSVTIEPLAYYLSHFRPRYYQDEEGNVDYRYAAERTSFYRLRAQFKIAPDVLLINDFYHYYDGLFSGQTASSQDRRFRNIARLVYYL